MKRIRKFGDDQSENSESFSGTDCHERRRHHKKMKEDKGKPYPTKNFLPNFKGPHLNFLQKYLKLTDEMFNSIGFINYLRNKDGISM
jgi:hypothetical protein